MSALWKNNIRYGVILLMTGSIIWACRKDPVKDTLPNPLENISWLDPITYPEDNYPTKARFNLGKKLFYDKNLSLDRTISCASCHKPELAFADNEGISPGVEGRLGFRNAPTLTNVAYQQRLFADGGVPDLELQVLAPLEDHNEMGINILEAVKRIEQDPEYIQLCQDAYQRTPDPYCIVRGIAAFERQIISTQTPWEQTVYNNQNQMSAAEKQGWEIFKASGCNSCHKGPNLTDQEYHNIGLYEIYEDEGRQRITIDENDAGKFKTPTLRNVMLTAPYMHDGSMNTIDEVLSHFESGGQNHPLKDERIKPLNWSSEDKKNIKAFFHSLTDTSFLGQYDLN